VEKQLNWKYSASQALNSGLLATTLAFASIFLLDKGLSNATIGIILAICNVSSIGIQTFFANFTDRHESVRLQDMLTGLLLVVILASVLLLFVPSPFIFLVAVIIAYSFTKSSTPFVNSLAFVYEDKGVRIKYGVARGFGSLTYALLTLFLGFIIEETSSNILPIFYIGLAALYILAVRSYHLPDNNPMVNIKNEEDEENEGQNSPQKRSVPISEQSLLSFLSKYRELVFMIIGLAFALFAQTMISTFFIHIVTPLGGDSSSVGLATFIAALVEFPVMMNFDWLAKKRTPAFWLKLSAVFYVFKLVLLYFATNLMMVYASQFLQFGAYALAYPAVVQYIKNKVDKQDLFKGQSLFTIGTTVSGVFASFLGGFLVDYLGVSGMVFVALLATIIGSAIIIKTLEHAPTEVYDVARSEN